MNYKRIMRRFCLCFPYFMLMNGCVYGDVLQIAIISDLWISGSCAMYVSLNQSLVSSIAYGSLLFKFVNLPFMHEIFKSLLLAC